MAWEVAKPTADGMMARMPELSRRAILRLSVGAAAGAAGAYALGTVLHAPNASVAGPQVSMTSAGAPLAPPPPLEPPTAAAPTYVDGSFVSAARGGVPTNWAIARPPGQTTALRPVIALHGKGQDAAGVMAGGVEQGLAQAVRQAFRRSRWSRSTAAEATGTSGRPARTPAPWCWTN